MTGRLVPPEPGNHVGTEHRPLDHAGELAPERVDLVHRAAAVHPSDDDLLDGVPVASGTTANGGCRFAGQRTDDAAPAREAFEERPDAVARRERAVDVERRYDDTAQARRVAPHDSASSIVQ
jgi:hypothetical protein